MRVLAVLVLAAVALAAELRLEDGRRLFGTAVRRDEAGAVLETIFGRLRVPADRLAGSRTAERTAKRAPEQARVTKTRWFAIESDLTDARARLYADQLDAFFDWMVGVYELDRERVLRAAPYSMRVFRRRADFKELQGRIAPDIERKGKAFAEGVAGFYSFGHGRIFLWDAEGSYGGVHLEVAKHETTHLLNDLLAAQQAIRVPTWFEEGSATYFSTYVATGGPATGEPEDHPAALAQVIGEIESGHPLTSRELRGVGWASFLGRQYSWGWALIRFCRQHDRGKPWPRLLEYLRTVGGEGVTDSEERRFLKAVGFKSSRAFDEAWHAHLLAAKPVGRETPLGTSPEVLERIAAMKEVPEALARNFARIGLSLMRAQVSAAAIVYLRAALRGGADEPEVAYALGVALAELAGRARDETWPDESVDALRRAVAGDPLHAAYRLELGRQMLLRARSAAAVRAARDMLGFALLLAGPDDDDIALARPLLDAQAALFPDAEPEELVAELAEAVPQAATALRRSLLYHLQAREDWARLADLVQKRMEEGEATLEERAMLAGLYKASDRLLEAEAIYAAILREEPGALHLWPDRIECLIDLGRRADAKLALAEAYEQLKKAPQDLGWVRRRLERLDIESDEDR